MKNILKYTMFFLVFLSFTVFANPVVKGTQPDTSNFLSMVLIMLIGIIIGALCIYLYSKLKIYSILSNERGKYLDTMRDNKRKCLFKYIGIVRELRESKEEKKDYNNDLINENEKLKNDLNKLKSDFEKSKKEYKSEKNTQEDIDADTISKPIILKIEGELNSVPEIYFTIPEKDGIFKNYNAKYTKSADSFYKVTPNKDKQKGRVSFISGENDLMALDNIDYYLNPVCEIENISFRLHAKRIEMINSGTVSLNGESWKIDVNNKVKIRLI